MLKCSFLHWSLLSIFLPCNLLFWLFLLTTIVSFTCMFFCCIFVIMGRGDIWVSCVICEGPGVGAGVTEANGLWWGVGGACMCGWGLITWNVEQYWFICWKHLKTENKEHQEWNIPALLFRISIDSWMKNSTYIKGWWLYMLWRFDSIWEDYWWRNFWRLVVSRTHDYSADRTTAGKTCQCFLIHWHLRRERFIVTSITKSDHQYDHFWLELMW